LTNNRIAELKVRGSRGTASARLTTVRAVSGAVINELLVN
jgi:hypothetical protein